jgi:hydroxyethylthiazole kinase/thiamine-phosphate diphosphorylase
LNPLRVLFSLLSLFIFGRKQMLARHLKLCVLTDFTNRSFDAYKEFILQAVQGGVTSVQLRAKNKSSEEILFLATQLKLLLQPHGIPLIINDHVDIAKQVDAEGVHLGQTDFSPEKAREILGKNKIIGISVETIEDLHHANQLDCIDYIAASAVFQSSSKLDCKTIWGLEGLQYIVKNSRHPVVAIGGINENNVKEIINSGACGIAVINAIHLQENPKQAVENLIFNIHRNEFLQIKKIRQKIKNTNPLILNLTNYVTTDFVANGLLSLGAAPIMSQAEEELEDLLKISQALVINPGTLNREFIFLCRTACTLANAMSVPIILDPVGVGASRYRTEASQDLIKDFKFAIIRGNASEIMALSGSDQSSKGVDSSVASDMAIASARLLAEKNNCVVVISGKTDFVVASKNIFSCSFGSELMPMITGTGCLLSAVTAAFHAAHANTFEAACAAVMFYGKCGEIAAQKAEAPATFKTNFLDALYFFEKEVS